MAVKKVKQLSEKVVTQTKKAVEVDAPPLLQVIEGNTGSLTVKFLAAINSQLLDIKKLLESK